MEADDIGSLGMNLPVLDLILQQSRMLDFGRILEAVPNPKSTKSNCPYKRETYTQRRGRQQQKGKTTNKDNNGDSDTDSNSDSDSHDGVVLRSKKVNQEKKKVVTTVLIVVLRTQRSVIL